ncbi:MAG: PGF-pre-PGF domain-containing protein [Candidatus Aenigmarchaeota archaeon]|nr:PGF-pre-PGF domain-containing protein [Candidatus Aenigmarchaeota archaeon]
MDNKNIVLLCLAVGIIFISFSVVTADYAEISVANNFSLSGRVKNSTLGNASAVNISVYGVTMQQNGPPLETFLSSVITTNTGTFNATNINNSYLSYSIKLLVNDSAGLYTETGPMLPPLPLQALQIGLENSTFYLVPAATLNLSAYNTIGSAVTFNYMVMDNSVAYPVKTSTGANGLVWNATVPVERNRNYTIMIMRDQSAVNDNQSTPPLSTVVNNLSSYNNTNYSYTLSKNISFTMTTIAGFVTVAANDSRIALNDAVVQLTPISGMIFPNSNFALGTPAITSTNGIFIADYNITVLGAASGIEYVIEFYGNGSGEYYASFQNISVGTNGGFLNTTLQKLAGVYDNTGRIANTSRVVFNVTNGSVALSTAHIEIEIVHNSFNTTNSKLRYMVDSLTNGTFRIAIINGSTVKVKTFSNQYAPKQSKFTAFPGTGMFNITLYPFNPEQVLANGSRVSYDSSSVAIAFYKDNATCSIPSPAANCFLGSFAGNFNPLKAMLGGKSNVMINSSNGIVTYFIGVDLIASGPPDAVMSDNSLANTTASDSLAQIWRFGSMAPEIYSHAYVSIPYNQSLVNESWSYKTVLPYLYDEDWNIVWNTTANGTNVTLADYSQYNQTWFTGMTCSKNNTASDCYMDVVNNRFWFRIPHFSGGDYNISGGTINVSLNRPADANISSLTPNTFNCSAASSGTLSNITFYIWNSTGMQNNNTNISGGTSNSSLYTYNFSTEGNYTWSCLVYDTGGSYEWALNRTIRIDYSAPNISNITNTSITDSSVLISWNTSEAASVNITYSANASDLNQTSTNTTYTTRANISIINLIPNLRYYYNMTVCNQVSNCTMVGTYNFTTLNDSTGPNITFIDPTDANGTTVGRNYSFVNISVNESNVNVSACWLEWSTPTSGSNITMTKSANGSNIYCYYNQTGLSDGLHNYTVHANDTLNNVYNTTVRFLTTDDSPPFITTYGPQETLTTTSANFSVTTNENATCHYSTNSGTSYSGMGGTFTDTGTSHIQSLTGLSAGTYRYYVRCIDLYNNINETDYTATITVASSASTSSSSGSSSSSTTAAKTEKKQSFSTMTPGIASAITSFDKSLGLREIVIMVNNTVTSVTITIDKVTSSAVPSVVEGTVYKLFEINKSKEINNDINYVNISFEVEKSWVSSNNIDSNLVYLYRYTTKWNRLATTKIGSDDAYYYTAKAPGLSYFAISGEKLVAICAEGAKECSGNILRECKNNAWITNATCDYGCNAATKACMSATGCEENSKQCIDNKLQSCLNSTWTLDKTCDYGCNSTSLDCSPAPVIVNETSNQTGSNETFAVDSTMLIAAVIVLIILGVLVYYFFFHKPQNKSQDKYSYKPAKKK